MRQRLIYFLKHNMTLQTLYRFVMSFIFRVLGVFVRIDSQLILFVSFMGKGFNDSPEVIYEYIKSHPEYKKYRCVWAFEHPEKFKEVETVKIDSLSYFIAALKAKYWVTNTNIERGLNFKKKAQIYLNTWHGIALKHIGNDCPGRKDYNFNTVNHLIVSGHYDEKIWKSAFNANPATYLRCGMPRNEQLWRAQLQDTQYMRKKIGIPDAKKVILYAPTWRESTDGGKSYSIKPPIHFDVWKQILGKDYIVLFRAHHQTTQILGVKYDEFVWDMSAYPQVNELMLASDLLITDYSAIAFDYSILGKPILCYAYDYDSYLAQRGTYFDMDEAYPNKSLRTEEELLNAICRIDYDEQRVRTLQFRDKFIQYGRNATQMCVETLLGRDD